jgi:hypothetical protein
LDTGAAMAYFPNPDILWAAHAFSMAFAGVWANPVCVCLFPAVAIHTRVVFLPPGSIR